jgi:small redox-active disulfide protein 2
MKIQVLGTGCQKCATLASHTEQAVTELGIGADISKVTDLKEIMALGVMMTPALVVDGTVKVSGRVPGVAEIKGMITQTQS